jgi:predicted outer membrane repeat protein
MNKTLLTATAIVLMYFNSYPQTTIPGGMVSGTWTHAGSPYNIMGPIMIPDGSTLTIEPGAVVKFQGTYKLYVLGQLLAIGNPRDSITFTASDTTNGWCGIRFDNTPETNDTSRLINCKLLYGKAAGTAPDNAGGALYFYKFSKAIISNCRISNCATDFLGGAIFCNYSSPIIRNNTISNNTSYLGGAISCYNSYSSHIISNNVISNNSAFSGGGIYFNGNVTIRNNFISNNSATYGGGISCDNNTNYTNISNNILSNNSASYGGALYVTAAGSLVITNTTMVNNQAEYGGAVNFDNVYPTLRNTILYGNTASMSGAQVFLNNENCDPDFYYCDVQGGTSAFGFGSGYFYTGIYQNNIDTIPDFIAESAGSGSGYNGLAADWSLQSGSHCINAGDPNGTYPATDLAGYPRVFNGIIDIGVYEFQGYVGINSIHNQDALIIYPNPVIDYLIIENQEKSTLEILNIKGQIIKTIHNELPRKTIYLGDLSSGVYMLKSITGNEVKVKRFIKL